VQSDDMGNDISSKMLNFSPSTKTNQSQWHMQSWSGEGGIYPISTQLINYQKSRCAWFNM